LKDGLLALFKGWMVRRCISVLENKVREYVNEEDESKKSLLKR
jgi:hypothetical protein